MAAARSHPLLSKTLATLSRTCSSSSSQSCRPLVGSSFADGFFFFYNNSSSDATTNQSTWRTTTTAAAATSFKVEQRGGGGGEGGIGISSGSSSSSRSRTEESDMMEEALQSELWFFQYMLQSFQSFIAHFLDSACELVMLLGGVRCGDSLHGTGSTAAEDIIRSGVQCGDSLHGTDSTAAEDTIRSGSCFPSLLPARLLSLWDCNIQNYGSKTELNYCGKTCTSDCFPLLPAERLLTWWDCNIVQNYSSTTVLDYCGKTCSFGPADVNNSIAACTPIQKVCGDSIASSTHITEVCSNSIASSTHITKVCSNNSIASPRTTKVCSNRFEHNCRVSDLWHARTTGMKILLDSHASVEMSAQCRGFTTKAAAPGTVDATAGGIEERFPQEEHQEEEEEQQQPRQKTLDDFQHEEIMGPTVERDTSALADEVRESLAELKSTILGFRKGLLFLSALQGLGACWSYYTWQTMNPSWQLLPSMLSSLVLAFTLRQALEPMTFFGKLEERRRLRLVTLCLMIFKGFQTFFNRGRIVLSVSAATIATGLLLSSWPFLASLLGFK